MAMECTTVIDPEENLMDNILLCVKFFEKNPIDKDLDKLFQKPIKSSSNIKKSNAGKYIRPLCIIRNCKKRIYKQKRCKHHFLHIHPENKCSIFTCNNVIHNYRFKLCTIHYNNRQRR